MNERQKHYTTEGRDNEYIQQTYDKKDMDNSEQVLYNNDNKYNSNTKTSDTDYAEQWMNKNQGLLRYAGDRAKKSINAGLAEAPSYMKDATEDTSFEKVQDTAVKRSLANDANDTKLYNLAVNEMIGHLSSENKEPYLKDALPLKNYIEAKDEYDFKNNNYTTTENVDTTPNEAVRVLQRELNKGNYTDKFGQKLKEDGIYAGKTAYADDRYREDIDKTNTNSNNYAMFTLEKGKKFNSAPVNSNVYSVTIQEPKMGSEVQSKVASANNTGVLKNNKTKDSYEKKIKESATLNKRSVEKARKSSEVISKNAKTIIEAGKKYGVNPAIIASCIYTEQIRNVNFRDTLTDTMIYWMDTSIGIGQVKVSTAKLMEDLGYIEKTEYLGKRQNWHGNSYIMVDYWNVPRYGIVEGSREKAISKRLTNDKDCIEYVAAYLKYWQDKWKDVYPEIDGRSSILGSLFNLGEKAKAPNPNPTPIEFGLFVKDNYNHMKYLLGIE